MFIIKHKSYKFGSRFELDQTSLDKLIALIETKDHKKSETILTGRTPVKIVTLPKTGSIVIKQYLRGGLLSLLNKDKYLFSKKSRSEIEFNAIVKAKNAGVNVPQPIAFIHKGLILYKAWLITEKIKDSENFVGLCKKNEYKAVFLLPAICDNINKLIANLIHHKDLHPGNIIIDKFDKPYILDFDKACFFSGTREKLVVRYRQRWQRAIKKYNLPDGLSNLQLN